jgi:hypothetical protein
VSVRRENRAAAPNRGSRGTPVLIVPSFRLPLHASWLKVGLTVIEPFLRKFDPGFLRFVTGGEDLRATK